MQDGLTISDASSALGITAHTLRYYERAGLLPPIPRTDGGLRRYRDEDVQLLRFLAKLRLTGMPIRQVRKYSELVRDGDHTMAARRQILEEHRVEVEAQIRQLQRSLEVLNLKINLYEQGWVHGISPTNECTEKLQCLLEEKG
ncbi:MAG: MerR family transcriptional regulator [Chlorobia bacterium]|nr:MerR family transcriptional regulator [Fimbriimonadaceae bacterium]